MLFGSIFVFDAISLIVALPSKTSKTTFLLNADENVLRFLLNLNLQIKEFDLKKMIQDETS